MMLTGIEREWRVLGADGEPIDFRTVVDDLPLGGRRLDPDDPHAHRCRWGGVITADGAEAEVATPPRPVGPGVAAELRALADLGLDQLRAAGPDDWSMEGYSTHLNVSVADRAVSRVAKRFARRFAVAQMMLLDRCSSPGLLVRPRRGRLELGGEYAAGTQLQAALTFAIAATAACAPRFGGWRQAPAPSLRLERAVGRFGWYVDRRAIGADLYAGGRRAPIRVGRHELTVQDYLERAWAAARPEAERLGLDDIGLVDEAVSGRRPLPIEQAEPDPVSGARTGSITGETNEPVGAVIDDITRPGFVLSPVVARWDRYAFAADDGTAVRYLVVDGNEIGEFLGALAAGRHDERIVRALRRDRRRGGVSREAAATGARRCV